jgi:hypothetical protein
MAFPGPGPGHHTDLHGWPCSSAGMLLHCYDVICTAVWTTQLCGNILIPFVYLYLHNCLVTTVVPASPCANLPQTGLLD